MVFAGEWRPEHRDDGVTDILVEGSFRIDDCGGALAKVLAHHIDKVLGREFFCNRRKRDDVGEKRSDLDFFSARARGRSSRIEKPFSELTIVVRELGEAA